MSAEVAVRGILLVAVVACGVVDLRERLIPDIVLWPAFALAAGLRLLALARGASPAVLLEGLGTAVVAWAVLSLVRVASRGRLGPGDAKLAALMGFVLGVAGGLVALFIASASGTAVALALIGLRRLRREDPLPFAPFLALGTAGALLLQPLVTRALGFAGLTPLG